MQNLKEQYPKKLEQAIIAALALVLLLFLAYPSVKVESYEGIKKQELIQVEIIPETHQDKPIPPPKRPAVPIVSRDAPPGATITPTVFDSIIPPPPPPPAPPDTFVAYDTEPKIIKLFKPVYPEIARRAGIEGIVFLNIQIDEKGNVINAKVLKGLGAGCDEAAIAAAFQCKFKPAMQRDKPVKVWISYSVRFRLK